MTMLSILCFIFRYQPVSYMLNSRSGDRAAFIDMVDRCNAVGVNIVADLVINHMCGHFNSGFGVGGSPFDAEAEVLKTNHTTL